MKLKDLPKVQDLAGQLQRYDEAITLIGDPRKGGLHVKVFSSASDRGSPTLEVNSHRILEFLKDERALIRTHLATLGVETDE